MIGYHYPNDSILCLCAVMIILNVLFKFGAFADEYLPAYVILKTTKMESWLVVVSNTDTDVICYCA